METTIKFNLDDNYDTLRYNKLPVQNNLEAELMYFGIAPKDKLTKIIKDIVEDHFKEIVTLHNESNK